MAARQKTARRPATPPTPAPLASDPAVLGDVLDRMELLQIRLYVRPPAELRYQGPEGAVSPALRRQLVAHKGALTRALLAAGAVGDGPAQPTAAGSCLDPAHIVGYSVTLGRWLCATCQPDTYALFCHAVAVAYGRMVAEGRVPADDQPEGEAEKVLDLSAYRRQAPAREGKSTR